MLKKLCTLIICCMPCCLFGQMWFCMDSAHCETGIVNASRSKGIVLSYEQLPGVKIESPSTDGTIARIKSNNQYSFKLRAPILNKDAFKMLLGFKFETEKTSFETVDPEAADFFNYISEKNLKSTSVDLLILKPFRGRAYIAGGAGVSMHGDFSGLLNSNERFMNFNVGFLIGYNKSPFTEYGFGFVYSKQYGFGAIPLPVIKYDRTFNDILGMEVFLPSNAYLRINTSEQNYLLLGIKAGNNAYNLDLSGIDEYGSSVMFSRTYIKYGLNFEQELFHPIWLSVSAGYQQNISYNVRQTFTEDLLLNSDAGGAPFFNVSIFMTNPKRN